MGEVFAVVDMESSGLKVGYHEMLELAIVPVDETLTPCCEPFVCRIKAYHPERASEEAMKINGLDLNEGTTRLLAKMNFETWMKNNGITRIIPIWHNGEKCDRGMIETAFDYDNGDTPLSHRSLDTCGTARFVNFNAVMLGKPAPFDECSVDALCDYFEIKREVKHRALPDCYDELEMLHNLIRKNIELCRAPETKTKYTPVGGKPVHTNYSKMLRTLSH